MGLRRKASWGIPAALLLLASCDGPGSYARLTVDVDVSELTGDEVSLVDRIEVHAAPANDPDPSLVHSFTVSASDLGATLAYESSFYPEVQKGDVVVSASLLDASGRELGRKSAGAKLVIGEDVRVVLPFVSMVRAEAGCRAESDPVLVSDGPSGGASFAVAWSTDHWLVVYSDASHGNGDLAAVALDAKGNRLGDPVTVNASEAPSTLPSIARDGDGFAVAWQEGGNGLGPASVQLRRVDALGRPVGNVRAIPAAGDESRPMLAEAYGGLAVAWMDRDASNQPVARVGFVDPNDFGFESRSPIDLRSPAATTGTSFPSLAMTDAVLAASWVEDGARVYSAELASDLSVAHVTEIHESPWIAQQLAMVSTGPAIFTAWEELSGDVDTGRERIRGAFSTMDGSLGADGIVHELYTGSANWPRAAWSARGNAAVVYYQYRDFMSQIYLTRYTPAGDRLDDADIQLTNVAGYAKYPDIRHAYTDAYGDHDGLGWVDDHSGVQSVYFEPLVCD